MLVLEADHVLRDAASPAIAGGAVAVRDGLVVACGTAAQIRAAHPEAETLSLGHACLMPGFVNAHQHGRGLSQVQLGFPDDSLEPWIARRRGRGVPDVYALTRLAALQMIENGVTATLHANYSYGSGDYEAELRASIRAYDEAGLRATICVGYADSGGLVYPPADEPAFLASLPPDVRALIAAGKPGYLPLAGTIDLMARLRADYAGHPRLAFAYGPAGPQWVSDEAWRALAADARKHGLGLHFHLLESPAQAACARALYPEGVLARLERLGVFETRASAAHVVHASARDIAEAARLGLRIVINPGSNMRLGNGAPPVAALMEAGIRFGLGTDNCALDDNEDYLSELRLGRLLGRSATAPAGDQLRTSIAAATEWGADAAFLADTGRIRDGFKADLVAIDLAGSEGAYLDPQMPMLEAMLARASGRDVLMTMVGGRILHRRGASTTAGAESIRAAARQTAAETRLDAGTRQLAGELAEALRRHYAAVANGGT
ncbi:MAG: amidohydrolase family protein [Bosea sp.]|uniref:amidohydrolase family protein n=1 Tax=Bosea sp. (in: a-proteobacteria) TaxID=1871050 RepID=UPI002384EDE9|nr:amidohydrolase family protein [Bosea sp. (in: a-proteobacteria)]MCP4740308.1 amidohydrolase family protein [Bosea sp. (in: a-proteobacteria)]